MQSPDYSSLIQANGALIEFYAVKRLNQAPARSGTVRPRHKRGRGSRLSRTKERTPGLRSRRLRRATPPTRQEFRAGTGRRRECASQALDWIVEWYRAFQAGTDLRRVTRAQIERYEKLSQNCC